MTQSWKVAAAVSGVAVILGATALVAPALAGGSEDSELPDVCERQRRRPPNGRASPRRQAFYRHFLPGRSR
jgi:hypothetical protein